MSTSKPYSATISAWLTANLGKHWGGALTGQDWPALKAVVEIVNAYASSDGEGRKNCVAAFGAMVLTMQPSCRYLAFHAVAHVLDWSDRWRLFRAAGLEIPTGMRECKGGPRPAPAAPALALSPAGDIGHGQEVQS